MSFTSFFPYLLQYIHSLAFGISIVGTLPAFLHTPGSLLTPLFWILEDTSNVHWSMLKFNSYFPPKPNYTPYPKSSSTAFAHDKTRSHLWLFSSSCVTYPVHQQLQWAMQWNIYRAILKEINPEYSLEGLRLKLKLQYSGHLMWRAYSLEKTLVLEKFESKRQWKWQKIRWLDSITNL